MLGSAIGVGLYSLTGVYGKKDRGEIARMLEYAVQNGVNFFDMADSYSDAEEFVGKVIAPWRKDIQLATKLSVNDEGMMDCSYHHVIDACKRSLLKLNTDYIDLYQIHFDDSRTSAVETVSALEYLKKEGIIRGYGLGHLPFHKVKDYMKTGNPDTMMMEFSPVCVEQCLKYSKLCKKYNIKILTMGTTARGLLTGKINTRNKFEEGDIRNIDPLFRGAKLASALRVLQKIEEIAKRYKKTPVQVAINWVINRPLIYIALVGPSNVAHLQEDLCGQGWSMTHEDMKELDDFILNESNLLKSKINEEIDNILSREYTSNDDIVADFIYVMEALANSERIDHEDILSIYHDIISLKKDRNEVNVFRIKKAIRESMITAK